MVWTFKIWTQIHHSPSIEIHHSAHVNPFHQNLFAIIDLAQMTPCRQSTAAKSGWKSAPRSLGCGPRQRGLGLTPQLLLDDHRCVPTPQRSSSILVIWLLCVCVCVCVCFDVTVFYLHSKDYCIILIYYILIYCLSYYVAWLVFNVLHFAMFKLL